MKNTWIYLLALAFLGQSCAAFKKSNASNPESTATKGLDKKQEFDHYYFSASKAKVLGNYEEALALYKKALKANPKSHAAMYEIAAVLSITKSYTEALHWSEKAVSEAEEYNHWYHFQLADLYEKNKDFKQASQTLERMIKLDPDRKANYSSAADMYVRSGDLASAAQVLESYHQRFGVQEESARKLERVYKSLKKPEKALGVLKDLSDAFPQNTKYKALYAEALLKDGQSEASKDIYHKLLQLDPQNGIAHFGLAELFKRADQKDSFHYHLQKGFSDPSINIQPKLRFLPYFFKRMATDSDAKNTTNSLTQALITTHSNEAVAYVTRCDYLMEVGEHEQARNALLKAVDLESGDYKTWEKLLQLDDELGNTTYLYADSKAALDLFPNINYVQLVHAYSCSQTKRHQEAIDVAESALDFTTDLEIKMQFLSILGSAYHNLGKGSESNAAMDELLMLSPDDDGTLNNYAFYLAERGESLDKATTMVQKALSVQPNSPIYQDTYGWVLYKKGDYKNAEVWMKKAYESSPDDADVKRHYTLVLEKLGKKLEQ